MTDLARNIHRCLSSAAFLTTASLAAGSALAAGSDLEEIVVTAQKQEQKLSETPLSVTAVSSGTLEALAATQFRDFANTVPGLSFTTSGVGDTQVNLRGITSGTNVSPTVGIYVDEVPYGSSTPFAGGAQLALDVGLFDLSRVEVLRGPQGTLYGASTMGGLLKYVTVVPDLKDVGGSARAGIAMTDEGGTSYDVAGAVNMPFVPDKAAARVSGFYSRDGGYVDNLGTDDDDANQSDVYGGRADVLLQPTDKLSLRLSAFRQDISRDGPISVDYDLATEKPTAGDLDQASVLPEPFDQDFSLLSATAVYDFDSAALTSVTSYQSLSNDSFLDATYVFGPGTGVSYGIGTDKFTQELRLAGTGPTIDWLVGAFYTHENSNQFQDLEVWSTGGSQPDVVLLTIKLPSFYEEIAGFGTLTWHVTEKLDLAGGLRYSHNSQGQEQVTSGPLAGLVPSIPEQESSEDVTTYLANLRYLANDHLMAYLRLATGYRPGGPNVVLYVDGQPLAPPTFDSDELQSYEGGIKVSSADRRFGADAAVYLINWDDMQVSAARNGFGVIANAESARSMGAELTLTAIPVPELTMVGAFAYIDAKLTDDAPDLGGKDGDRLPNTPDFTAAISADYAFSLNEHASSVGAVLRYVSDRVSGFDQNPYPNWDLPSYTTFDLRGSVAFGPANVRLYVRNLFDERGQLSAETVSTIGGGPVDVDILQPRTYGVSIDVDF
jgi:outer membrane receptor protein involved in Fe transport